MAVEPTKEQINHRFLQQIETAKRELADKARRVSQSNPKGHPMLPPWANSSLNDPMFAPPPKIEARDVVSLSESFTISFNDPNLHSPDHRARKLDEATEKLVQRALDQDLIVVSQQKDNVGEFVRFEARADFVKPREKSKISGTKIDYMILDEVSEQPKGKTLPAKRVKAISDQVHVIAQRERQAGFKAGKEDGYKAGVAAALKMVEDLQAQILPETSGQFIANMLWFRLNEKAGG